MSIHRDIPRDCSRTRQALANGPLLDEDDSDKNWLGHRLGSGAAAIDQMLLTGATMDEMKSTREDVRNHLKQLSNSHGLRVIEQGGIFTFDRDALG